MARRDWDDADDEAPASGTRALERALQETRSVYRQADAVYGPYSCPASGECCQLAVTKRQPWLWLPEWELLKRSKPLPPPRADGGCPYLDPGGLRCTVYADRPFGCRTFFCQRIQGPARQPSEEVARLLLRLERISQRVMPSLQGPRPLLEWYAGVSTAPAREEQ
ncbi:YkgJ family cysteine cluster protein [Corallococcus aberystwythensis]|uniref:YkgJ family cysteine cluster protein n=1 Tax=Corallococcus aberystwythensis TaxID=2316722 RepID=A0A3A8PRS3_9BACT|nr:YkgJ family cysteine cluster protein [Corallococcus aberystwythensis]RKH59063.1 YkgJ family cysteine cluster protein [Corallococcus aberystwythensis]